MALSYIRCSSVCNSLVCFRRIATAEAVRSGKVGDARLSFPKREGPNCVPFIRSRKNYCRLSESVYLNEPGAIQAPPTAMLSEAGLKFNVDARLDSMQLKEKAETSKSTGGRVMLIDGTSIIYRAYYKLLAKLHHGHLQHADGNGDWVLTIFTALSLILDVLEFIPSHVAVVFDHDGEI